MTVKTDSTDTRTRAAEVCTGYNLNSECICQDCDSTTCPHCYGDALRADWTRSESGVYQCAMCRTTFSRTTSI